MKEADDISKLFSINPDAWKSELMKRAATKYNEIFTRFKDNQILIINQCLFFFDNANDAYQSWYASYLGDEDRIKCAYASAVRCLVHYENIKQLLRAVDVKKFCNDVECNNAINKTSEMLVAKGWHGLPNPYDNNGQQHFKTSAGVVDDMNKFINARGSLFATEEEARSNKR